MRIVKVPRLPSGVWGLCFTGEADGKEEPPDAWGRIGRREQGDTP